MASKKTTTKKVAVTKKIAVKKAAPAKELTPEPGVGSDLVPEGPKYSAWQLRHNANRR